LKHLPFDTLKIDQSFIKDLPEDEDSAAIVGAIITLPIGSSARWWPKAWKP
jgi:EAL domain-containing protein (putative c-di-GMP-specific phosphodiesterase class I)